MSGKVFKSTQKFLLLSPRKLRPVAREVSKIKPEQALVALPYSSNKSARSLYKVVKTAVANAAQNGIKTSDLVFSSIEIEEGPRLRRGIAISRGQWHPIKKRMSHISVSVKAKTVNAVKKVSKTKKSK